jgi:DNA primase
MISRTTVDAVFDAARVEEVIGDFVQLKKSGSNYKGLSPFTEERSPSFMVSPVKQIWKDFSSGKGGNAVTFIMEHEHFTFPEAIKWLAKKYNIEVEETEQSDEQKQALDEKESMYLVSKFAAEWFQSQLKTEEGKAIGYSYFKERGFTDETIEYFQLGYNPDQWSAFTDASIKAGYQLDFLDKVGVSIVKEEKQFDRFKGRVMFPIRSLSGRVLGFGGRILNNEKKAAKYLNSPQSEIYDKSAVLYGIYEAKQSIAKEDLCYLVEGYTDVIQLHQAGVKNVVSSSGTALTSQQIRLIQRLTKNITVLYDGDAAGMRAAIRGTDLILEAGMNVRVCTFPDGEDPDSFAKAHTESEIIDFLTNNAQDFISFKSNLLKKEAAGDPIKKAGMIRDIVNSIAKIPDDISREIYIRESAAILDIGEDVLFSTLAQVRNASFNEQKKKDSRAQAQQPLTKVEAPEATVEVDRRALLERSIIAILLMYGGKDELFEDEYIQDDSGVEVEYETVKTKHRVYEKIYMDLQADEIKFANPDFQVIYTRIIDVLLLEQEIDTQLILSAFEGEYAHTIADIAMSDDKYHLHDWERHKIFPIQKDQTISEYTSQVLYHLRQLLLFDIVDKINKVIAKNTPDVDNIAALEQINNYNILRRKIDVKNRTVIPSSGWSRFN